MQAKTPETTKYLYRLGSNNVLHAERLTEEKPAYLDMCSRQRELAAAFETADYLVSECIDLARSQDTPYALLCCTGLGLKLLLICRGETGVSILTRSRAFDCWHAVRLASAGGQDPRSPLDLGALRQGFSAVLPFDDEAILEHSEQVIDEHFDSDGELLGLVQKLHRLYRDRAADFSVDTRLYHAMRRVVSAQMGIELSQSFRQLPDGFLCHYIGGSGANPRIRYWPPIVVGVAAGANLAEAFPSSGRMPTSEWFEHLKEMKVLGSPRTVFDGSHETCPADAISLPASGSQQAIQVFGTVSRNRDAGTVEGLRRSIALLNKWLQLDDRQSPEGLAAVADVGSDVTERNTAILFLELARPFLIEDPGVSPWLSPLWASATDAIQRLRNPANESLEPKRLIAEAVLGRPRDLPPQPTEPAESTDQNLYLRIELGQDVRFSHVRECMSFVSGLHERFRRDSPTSVLIASVYEQFSMTYGAVPTMATLDRDIAATLRRCRLARLELRCEFFDIRYDSERSPTLDVYFCWLGSSEEIETVIPPGWRGGSK